MGPNTALVAVLCRIQIQPTYEQKQRESKLRDLQLAPKPGKQRITLRSSSLPIWVKKELENAVSLCLVIKEIEIQVLKAELTVVCIYF